MREEHDNEWEAMRDRCADRVYLNQEVGDGGQV